MSDGFAYIGRAPCGCIRSACVDNEIVGKKDVAKAVAEMVRYGLTVDRVTIEDVRADKTWKGCEKCDPPAKQKNLPEEYAGAIGGQRSLIEDLPG